MDPTPLTGLNMPAIDTTVTQITNDANTAHQIVHGTSGQLVPTDNGAARTFSKVINDNDVVATSAEAARAAAFTANESQRTADFGVIQGKLQTAAALAASGDNLASLGAAVTPQDLSGFSFGIHRSTTVQAGAVLVYDTSKDSDGGDWINRCEKLGWYNEKLNGPWIPNCGTQGTSSELVARALGGTLGTNLIANANSLSGWINTSAGGSITIDSNGLFRVTNPVGGGYAGMTPATTIPTVVGAVYIVTFDTYGSVGTGGTQVMSAGSISNGAGRSNYVAINTNVNHFVFTATSTTLYLDLYTSGSFANGYTTWGNVQVRQVLSWAPSGSYFQNQSPLGQFYRLWKNRIPYSSDFTQAVWARTALSNVISKSDGYGDKVVIDATNSNHNLTLSSVVTALNIPHAATIRARAGEKSWLTVSMGGQYSYFNLTSGTIGTSTGGSVPSITAVPSSQTNGVSGYYDCTIVVSNPINVDLFLYVASVDNVSTYVGDGTSGLYVAQAQVEIGSVATNFEARTSLTDRGVTEVFRGNKARFPRVAGIVLDVASGAGSCHLVIYDLEEPGCPMWMSFMGDPTERGNGYAIFLGNSAVPKTISAKNGKLVITFTRADANAPYYAGFTEVDFPLGRLFIDRPGPFYTQEGLIEKRNIAAVFQGAYRPSMLSYGGFADLTSVAHFVYPDAPIGPDGVQVPTLALSSLLQGVRVRRHDGVVINLMTNVGNIFHVSFGPRGELFIAGGGTIAYRVWVFNSVPTASTNTPDFTFGMGSAPARPGDDGSTGKVSIVRHAGRVKIVPLELQAMVVLLMYNGLAPTSSAVAYITPTYNTGWMVGDIRRCLLSDTTTGVVDTTNQVVNGDFSSAVGWTLGSANANIGSGTLNVTSSGFGGGFSIVSRAFSVPSGTPCLVTYTCTAFGASSFFAANIGGTLGTTRSAAGTYTEIIVAGSSGLVGITATATGVTSGTSFDDLSVVQLVADRSIKVKPITAFGTGLTKAAVATGTQLVAYSGFSAANYLREAYSSDLDFGTSAWRVSSWISIPVATFGVNSPASGGVGPGNIALIAPHTNFAAVSVPMTMNTAEWTKGTGWSAPGAGAATLDGTQVATSDLSWTSGANATPGTHVVRRWTVTVSAIGGAGGIAVYANNGNQSAAITATGTYYIFNNTPGLSQTATIRAGAGVTCTLTVTIDDLQPAPIVERSAASGAYWRLGVTPYGYLVGEAFDGTTRRPVVSAVSFAGYNFIHAAVEYATSGAISLKINNGLAVSTTGAPLLTLNNASAVLTVGNNFALTGPFPGSISLVRAGVTTASPEQATAIYENEKLIFQAGAQITMPDSSLVSDVDYDPVQDKWRIVTPTSEATYANLIRTSANINTIGAGAVNRVQQRAGVKLAAHATPNQGVDLIVPTLSLKEELVKRSDDATRIMRQSKIFDFDATTGQTDFTLPIGWETLEVLSAGSSKREGSTKDWIRLYDGFKETIRFAVAPGNAVWVQIIARRIIT